MDKLSFLGLFVALGAIALGYSMEGGVLSALFNGPALVIVIGGTLGAVMLQSPVSTFTKALRLSHWVFFRRAMILTVQLNKLRNGQLKLAKKDI